jgi:hypothetical protein
MLRSTLVMIVVMCADASGQPAPAPASGPPAPAAPAAPGDAEYLEGRRFYDLHEWDSAIAKFKEAYRLRADPASLFNIAQSYRLKGDCREALSFYQTYQRNFPDAPNADRVAKFIESLEPCAKQQAANAQAEPAGVFSARPAPVRDEQSPKRTWGLIAGGAGLVLVGTGTVFGVMARARANDLTTGGDPAMPPVFDPELEASGQRWDTLAKITLLVGGAALVGGVVMYVIGTREARTSVSLAPRTGGAVLAWTLDL